MRLAKLSAVVAVLGIVAACGGGGRSPTETLHLAASETQAAKTARMAFSMSGLPSVGTMEATGKVDLVGNKGTMEMTMPEVRGRSLGTMEMVFDGTIIYMKFPAALGEELGGKQWVRIDAGKVVKQGTGVDISSLAQGSGKPNDALSYLRGAGSDTTELGKDTVRGEETTHYRTTIDRETMLKGTEGRAREEATKLADVLGDQRIRADVWVDGEGRLRKMSYPIDMSKLKVSEPLPDQLQGARLTYTFEFYDFGTPVDVQAPPPDQTVDMSELAGQPGD